MKGLVKVLAFGCALFVLASAGVVKAQITDTVPCGTSKCTKNTNFGIGQEIRFIADCTQQGYKVENMVCHKAKGIVCGNGHYNKSKNEWLCDCQNMDMTKTHSTTVDVWCVPDNK